MLRVEALQIRRGGKTVLADITLDLLPGEVLGVLGPMAPAKVPCLGRCAGSCSRIRARSGWISRRSST